MSLALEKIKVLEIGTLIAAPFATRILAEFGAEVIKLNLLAKATHFVNGVSYITEHLCGGIYSHVIRNL